jgi:hypothetical protein
MSTTSLKRVAEKRKRDVLGQGFGHDAGANNGSDT